ncbi:unnamed protein product [Tuber melanosporum]|uniref:(Perigord truffle) hypothetical protein n=1 Tax=Tuber melanosporum (strain Mel28) TaxID=656061 RepID=D5G7K5_TUBMM|nr:uncharacterized protein GSTUM_00004597001 [Tuber melanosporum]CAZ80498.1 unnamed protein product [Tuber melanosporum]
MEIDFPIPTQNRYPRLRLDQMESPPSSPSSLASSLTVKASSSPPPSPSEDEEGSDSDDPLDPLGTLESDNIENIPCSQNPARRYYVPRKRSRSASSPIPLHYCSRTGKGKREDELLSTQGPPRKRKRGRKASGEGGDGGVLEAEAASRKPSDWDGEKWWRMTYSEDEEFDKKEQELEELAKEEKEWREKEWVAKRERLVNCT